VQVEGGGGEQSDRTRADLGRLLAAAGGYRVLASDGTHLGWLDHVRYERHADHPDEVVVRSRRLLARRRRVFPFRAVAEVRRGERTVVAPPDLSDGSLAESGGGAFMRPIRRRCTDSEPPVAEWQS